MMNFRQIEKIMTLFYLNSTIKTVSVKYNGFSHFGPYEYDIDDNTVCAINGDGEVIINNNGMANDSSIVCYIAGSHVDRDYKLNREQLYTLAAFDEIFNHLSKGNIELTIDEDLSKDYIQDRFDIYKESIRKLLK